MEISVAAVLIRRRSGEFLFSIVSLHALRRAENARAGINQQMNVALEMNRAAQISSRRNKHRSPALLRRSFNGFVDGRAVEISAVAFRAELADVENRFDFRFMFFRDTTGEHETNNG